MGRILASAIVAVFLALIAVARGVSGQIAAGMPPPPSPTVIAAPTATATPAASLEPDARLLLRQALAAQRASGSMRFTERTTISAPRYVRLRIQSHGDVSFSHDALHQYDVRHQSRLDRHPATTAISRDQVIYAGTWLASRRQHGPWRCTNLKKKPLGLGQVVSPLSSRATLSYRFGRPANLLLGGIPVRDVQVVIDLPGLASPKHPAVEDVYISRADGAIVRETVSARLTFEVGTHLHLKQITVTEAIVQNDRAYGEPVSINLPAACRHG